MKLYLTVGSCLILGVTGILYYQSTTVRKSDLFASQNKEILNLQKNLDELDSKLIATKLKAEQVSQTLRAESDRLATQNKEILSSQKSLDNLSSKLAAFKLESQKVNQALKEETDKRSLAQQRAECIINQRNLQQIVRGYQNTNGFNVGNPFNLNALIAEGKYLQSMPKCASGSPYTIMNTIPQIGKLVATCKHVDQSGSHIPVKFADW